MNFKAQARVERRVGIYFHIMHRRAEYEKMWLKKRKKEHVTKAKLRVLRQCGVCVDFIIYKSPIHQTIIPFQQLNNFPQGSPHGRIKKVFAYEEWQARLGITPLM